MLAHIKENHQHDQSGELQTSFLAKLDPFQSSDLSSKSNHIPQAHNESG